MSSTGGGIVVRAQDQQEWTSPDLSVVLTLHNDTNSDVTVTSDQCVAMVDGLDDGSYQTTWDGSVWSTPSP